MKLKIQITKTRLPVYRSSLWIVVSNSVVASIDHVEDLTSFKIHPNQDRNSTQAYTYAAVDDKGRKHFFLFLRPTCKPGELVHEIKHVVNLVFLWHGVKLSASNDEAECYYLERVTNKVFDAILKYKKTFKKKVTKDLEMPTIVPIIAS
jgi:hypothetical protein